MARQTLTGRVEILEGKVEPLLTLPDSIGALELAMREGFESLRAELRAEIRAGDEETRRLMRVRHGDVIERIARLGGNGDGPRRRRRT